MCTQSVLVEPIQGRFQINLQSSEISRSEQQRRTLEQACVVAKIADEYRGTDTIVLDMTQVTPIVDYFVITTGTSRRQMHAIAKESDRTLKASGSRPYGMEGYEESSWILQDYGDIVLHLFTEETRALYDLEHLWADAPQVDWKAQIRDTSEQ